MIELEDQKAKAVGNFLMFGGIVILAGILIAQSLFPGYDQSTSAISDLGAPIELAYQHTPGVLTVEQPASIVFIGSFLLGTILIIQAARVSPTVGNVRWFRRFLMLFGIGAILVVLSYIPYYLYSGQLIPGSSGDKPLAVVGGGLVHIVGATMGFFFGAFAAIASYKFEREPMGYLSIVAGLITITAFLLDLGNLNFGLGNGGMERVAAYPLFVWMLGLGTYLRFARS
jgi:hypothetical membrane protein